MGQSGDETVMLLERWYEGEDGALGPLLARNLEWMQRHVRSHLNPPLRQRFDSMDIVQDGVLRLLRYGPRFAPRSEAQFRALVARILITALRDRIGRHRAAARDIAREEALPDEGISRLAIEDGQVPPPDQLEEQREVRRWIHVAIDLLEPLDQKLIRMRQFEQRPFPEIAAELELGSPSAARMRYNRALPRLAQKIRELRVAFD